MENENTDRTLQIALGSYDRKELRVQKNYIQEQCAGSECTCFQNGSRLLEQLRQGRELYRMPGRQYRQMVRRCQELYEGWGIRQPDMNSRYLSSAVGVVYGTIQKLAIRKEILQAVGEQYEVLVSAVDSGIRRMVDQLEARPTAKWLAFKDESGFADEKPTTGKLIYAVKNYLQHQKGG